MAVGDSPLLEVLSLKLHVIQGDDLVAKDKNILGQWTTSDPYVVVSCYPMGLEGPEIKLGKSQIVRYTLSPRWDESFEIELPTKSITDDLQFVVTIMDWDEDLIPGMIASDDDLMGVVPVNVPPSFYRHINISTNTKTKWYGVPVRSASRASGRIECKLDIQIAQKTQEEIKPIVVKEPKGRPILDQKQSKKDRKNKGKDDKDKDSKDKDSKKEKKGLFGFKRSNSKDTTTTAGPSGFKRSNSRDTTTTAGPEMDLSDLIQLKVVNTNPNQASKSNLLNGAGASYRNLRNGGAAGGESLRNIGSSRNLLNGVMGGTEEGEEGNGDAGAHDTQRLNQIFAQRNELRRQLSSGNTGSSAPPARGLVPAVGGIAGAPGTITRGLDEIEQAERKPEDDEVQKAAAATTTLSNNMAVKNLKKLANLATGRASIMISGLSASSAAVAAAAAAAAALDNEEEEETESSAVDEPQQNEESENDEEKLLNHAIEAGNIFAQAQSRASAGNLRSSRGPSGRPDMRSSSRGMNGSTSMGNVSISGANSVRSSGRGYPNAAFRSSEESPNPIDVGGLEQQSNLLAPNENGTEAETGAPAVGGNIPKSSKRGSRGRPGLSKSPSRRSMRSIKNFGDVPLTTGTPRRGRPGISKSPSRRGMRNSKSFGDAPLTPGTPAGGRPSLSKSPSRRSVGSITSFGDTPLTPSTPRRGRPGLSKSPSRRSMRNTKSFGDAPLTPAIPGGGRPILSKSPSRRSVGSIASFGEALTPNTPRRGRPGFSKSPSRRSMRSTKSFGEAPLTPGLPGGGRPGLSKTPSRRSVESLRIFGDAPLTPRTPSMGRPDLSKSPSRRSVRSIKSFGDMPHAPSTPCGVKPGLLKSPSRRTVRNIRSVDDATEKDTNDNYAQADGWGAPAPSTPQKGSSSAHDDIASLLSQYDNNYHSNDYDDSVDDESISGYSFGCEDEEQIMPPICSSSKSELHHSKSSSDTAQYQREEAAFTQAREGGSGCWDSWETTPSSRNSIPKTSEHSRGRIRRNLSTSNHKRSIQLKNAPGPDQSSPRSVENVIDPDNAPGFCVDADGNEYYLSRGGKKFHKDPVTGGYYADGFGASAQTDNDFGFFVDASGREYFVDEQGIEHHKDDDTGEGDFGFFMDADGRHYFLDRFGVEHFKEDNMDPHPVVAETGFFLDADRMEYYLDSAGQEYYKNPLDGEFYTHPHQNCEGGQKLRIQDLPAKDKRAWEARWQRSNEPGN